MQKSAMVFLARLLAISFRARRIGNGQNADGRRGVRGSDNGLLLTRRELVMRWHSSSHGFGFQADLVTRLISRGVTYKEIPVEARERATGESKALTFRNLASVCHSLLNIAIRRISRILYGKC